MYAKIIIDIASEQVDRLFTYRIPASLKIEAGMRVEVPFGHQSKEGYVLEVCDHAAWDESKIRDITAVLEDYPVLLP